MTAPLQTAILASVQPARIETIVAAEGQAVRQGDLIVQLEEGVQAARTQTAKAAAESSLGVELAQTRWQQAQRDLDRLVRLNSNDQTSSKELSDAFSLAEIARLEYEIARFNQSQASLAYERERHLLEEFRIRAPFDGYVVEHLKHPGETLDQLEGVVRVAQLDPLVVTVDCQLSLAGRISAGDEAQVRPADRRFDPRVGRVVLASGVADGASQTFRVKLAVGNGDAGWIAGLKVFVEFQTRETDAAGAATLSPPAEDSRRGPDTDRDRSK